MVLLADLAIGLVVIAVAFLIFKVGLSLIEDAKKNKKD